MSSTSAGGLPAAEGDLPPLLQQLTGGDRRSIGHSAEVVAEVLADPALFPTLFAGMTAADPLVRIRAADAVEKVTAQHEEWLQPFKAAILATVARIPQQEVRWHVAQLIPRLDLSPAEQQSAVEILCGYCDDKSSIVKTSAMQALADLAYANAALRPEIVPLLEQLTLDGTPAMRSRGRKLLAQLGRAT